MTVLNKLYDGHRYMKAWPMIKQLGYFFPEYRVVKATQIAIFSMPLLAIICCGSQLYLSGWGALPQALCYGLFFLSLPVQGLIWLGWRARHPLPLTLFHWGQELCSKLSTMGVQCKPLTAKACYFDIAFVLKTAFERLEPSYWEDL